MSENKPYAIYSKARPVRILFVINSSQRKRRTLNIIRENVSLWGGANNSIIFLDKQELTAEQKQFISKYDPDCIFIMFKPKKALVRELDEVSTPIVIHHLLFRGDEVSLGTRFEPLRLLPTSNTVKQLYGSLLHENVTLVLFDVSTCKNKHLIEFLEVNFGVCRNPRLSLKRQLETIEHRVFDIVTVRDFYKAVDYLANRTSKPVFLNQLCSYKYRDDAQEPEGNYEKFTVVIGDANKDLAAYWMHKHFLRKYLSHKFTGIWIPTYFKGKTKFLNEISRLINRFYYIGNEHGKSSVNVVSSSIQEADLIKISDELKKNVVNRNLTVLNELVLDLPVYKDQVSSVKHRLSSYDRHKCYSSEEHLVIEEPKIPGLYSGTAWMCDFWVERGDGGLLRLPVRSHVIGGKIFDKPTRINSMGGFSSFFNMSHALKPKQNYTNVNIPEDHRLIRSYLLQYFQYHYTSDLRNQLKKKPFYIEQRPSQEGLRLNALLNLFGGVDNAGKYFDSHFWRSLFDSCLGIKASKKDIQLEVIENTLKKEIAKMSSLSMLGTQIGRERLSSSLYKSMTSLSSRSRLLSWEKIEKIAHKEIDEHNALKGDSLTFSDDDLRELEDNLNFFIERKIFFMGIRPRCQHCNIGKWILIKDLDIQVNCEGCGNKFYLNSREKWLYKLNQEVMHVIADTGIVTVLMIINHLRKFGYGASSMFFPSTELFVPNKKAPDAEVDFVAIMNGQFVISEIKTHAKGFKQSDFDDVFEIASNLKPDMVILGAQDDLGKTNLARFNKLKNDLEAIGIFLRWHRPIVNCFEPSPYFY